MVGTNRSTWPTLVPKEEVVVVADLEVVVATEGVVLVVDMAEVLAINSKEVRHSFETLYLVIGNGRWAAYTM